MDMCLNEIASQNRLQQAMMEIPFQKISTLLAFLNKIQTGDLMQSQSLKQVILSMLENPRHILEAFYAIITHSLIEENEKKAAMNLIKVIFIEHCPTFTYEEAYAYVSTLTFNWTISSKVKMFLQGALQKLFTYWSSTHHQITNQPYQRRFLREANVHINCYLKYHCLNNQPSHFDQSHQNIKLVNLLVYEHFDKEIQDLFESYAHKIPHMLDEYSFLDTMVMICSASLAELTEKSKKVEIDEVFIFLKQVHKAIFAKYGVELKFVIIIQRMLENWEIYFQKITKLQTQTDQRHFVDEIINCHTLLHTLRQIYQFKCQSTVSPCNYLQITENWQSTMEILIIKQYASELEVEMLNYAQEVNLSQKRHPLFIRHCHSQLNNIVATLVMYNKSNGSEEKEQAANFITNLVSMLRLYFIIVGLNLDNHEENICTFIIFPLLKTNSEQFNSFEDKGSDFISTFEDYCSEQAQFSPKIQAIKFLEYYADHSPTRLDSIMKLIKYSLAWNFKNEQLLTWLAENGIYFSGIKILESEQCFLMLSILSYKLHNKDEPEIRYVCKLLSGEILKVLSPLERCRAYGCLAFNFEEIYCGQSYCHLDTILEHAFINETHPTCILALLDLFNNVSKVYITSSLFQIFVQKAFSYPRRVQIVTILAKIIKDKIANIQLQVIHHFIKKLKDQIINESLLIGQFKAGDSSLARSIEYIYQCVTLVKIVAENKSYINSNPDLRSEIFSVVEMMQWLMQIHVDDAILGLFSTILLMNEGPTEEQCNQYVVLITKNFQSNQFANSRVTFTIFDSFIARNQTYTKQLEEITLCLITGFALYVHFPDEKVSRQCLAMAEIIVMLQNIVRKFKNLISLTYLEQMCSNSLVVITDELSCLQIIMKHDRNYEHSHRKSHKNNERIEQMRKHIPVLIWRAFILRLMSNLTLPIDEIWLQFTRIRHVDIPLYESLLLIKILMESMTKTDEMHDLELLFSMALDVSAIKGIQDTLHSSQYKYLFNWISLHLDLKETATIHFKRFINQLLNSNPKFIQKIVSNLHQEYQQQYKELMKIPIPENQKWSQIMIKRTYVRVGEPKEQHQHEQQHVMQDENKIKRSHSKQHSLISPSNNEGQESEDEENLLKKESIMKKRKRKGL